MREGLNRYLQARTGLRLSVRPLSTLPGHALANESPLPLVCSDGQFIYLADDISHFENQEANRHLYKCLTRLESAYYEFGTFLFDLDRALELCCFSLPDPNKKTCLLSDAEQFLHCFPIPQKAAELFAIFEQGRLRLCLNKHYPGIIRAAFPLIVDELKAQTTDSPLTALFSVVGLGMPVQSLTNLPEAFRSFVQKGRAPVFNPKSTLTARSKHPRCFVQQFYPELEKLLFKMKKRMIFPLSPRSVEKSALIFITQLSMIWIESQEK